MRSDITPGAKFPDYELPDHAKASAVSRHVAATRALAGRLKTLRVRTAAITVRYGQRHKTYLTKPADH